MLTMTKNALKYCLLQIYGYLLLALIPASFIGVLKGVVEGAYGHSVFASAGPAAIFFFITYFVIVVSGSVGTIVALNRKAKNVGVSLDYLGGLSRAERLEFEKKHGL